MCRPASSGKGTRRERHARATGADRARLVRVVAANSQRARRLGGLSTERSRPRRHGPKASPTALGGAIAMNVEQARARSLTRRALEQNGYLRRPNLRWGGGRGHKEWLHFTLHGEGLDVLANFSVVDDTRPEARTGMQQNRIVCLVREREWQGDIDHYPGADVSTYGSPWGLAFADNLAAIEKGRLRLKLAMQRLQVSMDVELD